MWKYTSWTLKANVSKGQFPRAFSGWCSNQELRSPWPRCGFIERKNAHTHVWHNHASAADEISVSCIVTYITIYFTADFILFIVMCICMIEWCTYVGVHPAMARRSGDKFVELLFSFQLYKGSWDWNQAVRPFMANSFTHGATLLAISFNFFRIW